MRYLLIFLISTTLFAEEKMEEKEKQEKPLVVPVKTGEKSVMMIDAKDRAGDFLKAYSLLKQEKASARIFFKLTNGTIITNIVDLSLFQGNTLFLFKVSSLQGVKYTVVPIEEIQEIGNL